MEGYSHGSQFGREKAGELGYAVKRVLYKGFSADVRFPTVVAITQVKEFATGNGKASKQDMMDAVVELWDLEFKNDNAADAYVMARIAYALDTGSVATSYQADVLKKIQAPKKPKKKRVRQKVSA
jgi:Holliday junction resolvasome RuvABC endonuclease subunit